MQRINRKLKQNNQQIRRARGGWDGPRWVEDSNLGRHYVIDVDRNWLVAVRVDLEAMGREIGVLEKWEQLSEE